MRDERYRCVCHTCDGSTITDELLAAQSCFNEHADRGCEIVIRRVDSPESYSAAAQITVDTPSDDSQPASE